MSNLHYVDLSTSNDYEIDNNKEDLITTTENSFETESGTSEPQDGGFFWSNNGATENDKKFLLAARQKNYTVVDFMINQKMISCLSAQDDDGNTILHLLSNEYSTNPKAQQIMQSLLSNPDIKSSLNVQNSNGDTPLISAVKSGSMELSSQLIKLGADPSIKNKQGLHVASEVNGSDSEKMTDQELTDSINNVVNMFVRMGKPVVLDSEGLPPVKSNNYRTSAFKDFNLPDHLSSDTIGSVAPMAYNQTDYDKTSSVSIKDTDAFLNMLEEKYIRGNAQAGGSKGRSGNRQLRYYGFESSYDGAASDSELNRMIENQATEIHRRVVDKIKEILGVDEVTARGYKAVLYTMVKEQKPELSNYDRAIEMEKMTTESVLKSLDKKKIKEIEAHIKEKDKERMANKSDESKKESKPKRESKSDKEMKPKKESKSDKEVKPKKGKKADMETSDATISDNAIMSLTSDSSLDLSN